MKALSKRFGISLVILFILVFFFILADRSFRYNDYRRENNIRTVAVLMPSIQEMVCYIGGTEKIVATSDHSVYPDNIVDLPKVAGYKGIDYEKLARISPDAVFSNKVHDSEREKIESLGISYFSFDDTSVSAIRESMKKMAKILSLKNADDQIEKFFKNPGSHSRKNRTAIIVIGSSDGLKNIYISGKGNIFSELLSLNGLENAYTGNVQYPSVGAEELIRMNPDLIFVLDERNYLSQKDRDSIIDDWRKLDIDALNNNGLFILNGDHLFIPGPRIEMLYEQMVEACDTHPQ